MTKSTTQTLKNFRASKPQISDEQWELLLPILKKQIRERRPTHYTLSYSPRAGMWQRIKAGPAFYRAVRDYCPVSEGRGSVGIFIYPVDNSLCFEVVGWVVE